MGERGRKTMPRLSEDDLKNIAQAISAVNKIKLRAGDRWDDYDFDDLHNILKLLQEAQEAREGDGVPKLEVSRG